MFAHIAYLPVNLLTKEQLSFVLEVQSSEPLCTRDCVIVERADCPHTSILKLPLGASAQGKRDCSGRQKMSGDGAHPAHRSPHFLPSLEFISELGSFIWHSVDYFIIRHTVLERNQH